MPALRSRTVTHGRNMAGARALWRATGMTDVRLRQADRRDRQQLHPVRARPRPPAGTWASSSPSAVAEAGGVGTRVQHDRRRRRHRDGPRRHALLAAQPRADRRLGRVHGQRALRRRPGLHLQLRQDHARHAAGRAAAEHPDRVRLRRPDGGRQGRRSSTASRKHPPRPDRRDDRVRRPEPSPTRSSTRSSRSACPTCGSCSGMFTANSMNCLHRGARPRAAGQRLDAGHRTPPAATCS